MTDLENLARAVGQLEGTVKEMNAGVTKFVNAVEKNASDVTARLNRGDRQFDRLAWLTKLGIWWLVALTVYVTAKPALPGLLTLFGKSAIGMTP